MTIAVNHGYAMATNPDVAKDWNARHEAPQSVAEYRATMARLASRFPDSVKQVH